MRTITLSNNKGGSAETTTTVSLASAFAESGMRVLVIDLDPQGSATFWLGGHESSTGLVEFSDGGIRVAQLVQASSARNVDLIPSSASLVPSGEKNLNDTGLALVRASRACPTTGISSSWTRRRPSAISLSPPWWPATTS